MKRAAPRRALAGIALAVLAAHALLLGITPATLEPAQFEAVASPVVFNARQLPPAPPAAAVALPAQQAARPAVRTAVKRARPTLPRTPPFPAEEAVAPALLPDSHASAEAAAAPETTASAPEAPLAMPLAEPTADATPQPTTASFEEAFTPPPATPPEIPSSVKLTYDVQGQAKGLNYTARGELVWRRDAGSYEASMVIKAFLIGERSMTSVGDITAQGLLPRRFADKARSERAAHFDPAQGRITFSANTPPAPWQTGAQDRLSVFMQIAGLMAADPARFAPGSKLPIYTASARDASIWTFTVHAPEPLDLPLGPVSAIKLTRDARRDFDQQVEVWFAPSLYYLPVRIRLVQHNGDVLDQQLAATSNL